MDSESDSNQSQEMFSDDEPVTDDCRSESPRVDVSFIGCSQSSITHSYSMRKETLDSPEIPKTPLSLGPFISKAEVWTSDLETPEQKRPVRNDHFSSERGEHTYSRIVSERPRAILATPPTVRGNSTVDEIIPTSQMIPIDRDKRRPSRRIIDHVTNDGANISKFDKRLETQNILGIIEGAQSSDLDNRDGCKSKNEYGYHGETMKGNRVGMQINQVDELDSDTLEERVRQLRELQERRINRRTHQYVSDAEFSKSLKSLVNVQNDFGDQKTNPLVSSRRNQLGFIPFSHISLNLDSEHFDHRGENVDIEKEIFHGFTKECQDESNEKLKKFTDILFSMNLQMLSESPGIHDDFVGFSIVEYNQSHLIAKTNEKMFKTYLDNDDRFFKKVFKNSAGPTNSNNDCLSPLSLFVDTGFRTASGNEIFVSFDIIHQSKSGFLEMESNLTEHSIDELIQNITVGRIRTDEMVKSPRNITKNEEPPCNNDVCTESMETENADVPRHSSVAEGVINSHDDINFMDGFKTARGACVQISKEALERANTMFNEEDDNESSERMKCDESVKSKPIMKSHEAFRTVPQCSDKFQNVGLMKQTSHKAEPKPHSIFENEKDLFSNNCNTPMAGFQTGLGKSIDISKSALLKASSIFADDMKDDSITVDISRSFHGKGNSDSFPKMAQYSVTNKRKHPVDDDTPVGRKKTRTGTDLQGRKLFNEIEDEDNYIVESALWHDKENHSNTDRNTNFTPLQDGKLINNRPTRTNYPIVSNNSEVEESVAALLKDEENSNGSAEDWSNNFGTDLNLIKNRWSEGLSWQKCDRTLEKRSRSCPGTSDKMENKFGVSFVTNTSVRMKLPLPLKNEEIPEDILFDSPFPEDFIDPHVIEQNRKKRLAAIAKQQALIELKKQCREHRVIKGSHLHSKDVDEKLSLKDLFKAGLPNIRTPEELFNAGIDPRVLTIDSESAIDYQFRCVDFFGQTFMNNHCEGIQLTDGAILIPNDDLLAGVAEFKQCFLASPGVDVSLVPNGYVENHYRWIVWKLAAMDRLKWEDNVAVKFLTPNRVMCQLKYRYDREIDRSQRPALRRILEKDDPSTRRLVLCVSKIFTPNNDDRLPSIKNNHPTLELTDGWYSIRASIDYAMLDYMKKGKIQVGTKLMTYGAELLNLDEGRYPLDITDDVRLKIHTNSTRRVKWFTKLGYQRRSGPILCKLKSINPNGGLVGKCTVAVARIYPIIYREKVSDGQFVDRNARCEEKVSIAFEAEYQSRIEAMCSDTGRYRVGKWKTEMENRMMNSLPVHRDVTPITKIKIADGVCSGLITLWSGAEESQSLFKENALVTVRNALASGKKLSELQITANRYTNFEVINTSAVPNCIGCPVRVFTSLDEPYRRDFNPHYGEFDTIGVVASVGPAPHGMKNFETVNLAFKHDDNELSPSFYLSILFWQGISSYGFTEIATVGSFIACSNLEWRRNTYKSIPTAFCTERTVLTRNPKQNHLCRPFEDLRARITDTQSYAASCAMEIQNEIVKKSRPSLGSSNNTPCSESRNNSPRWTPCHLDGNSESLVTPNSTLQNNTRAMSIQNRIDKLRSYGAPPSLSPIHLPQTPKIALDYRSPIGRPPLVLKPHTK